MFQPTSQRKSGPSSRQGVNTRGSSRDSSPVPTQRKLDMDIISLLNRSDSFSADSLSKDPQVAIFQLLRYIANSQKELSANVVAMQERINILKTDNKELRSEVKCLTEEVVKLDQYSRKGVMTVTGLEYENGEEQEALESSITSMLNEITPPGPGQRRISPADFVAVHRKGKATKIGRNNEPRQPTDR